MSAENNHIDLFIHREGVPPKAIRAAGDEPLAEVLKRAGLEPLPGLHVFVGETLSALDDAARDAEDGEDVHEPVDPACRVEELGHPPQRPRPLPQVPPRGRHRQLPDPTRTPPLLASDAGRQRETAWARRRFHLTDADAENFILQVCDSDRRPRPEEHLGELVHAPDCKLCFDLVPDKKIEG